MKDKNDSTRREKDLHRQTKTVPPESVPPAEVAFFQEQQKYQVLVERAPLGIALIDSQGRYKYVNPKFVEMFGYSREDIPTGQEWFAKVYPENWCCWNNHSIKKE